jgi:hypothetical protein
MARFHRDALGIAMFIIGPAEGRTERLRNRSSLCEVDGEGMGIAALHPSYA